MEATQPCLAASTALLAAALGRRGQHQRIERMNIRPFTSPITRRSSSAPHMRGGRCRPTSWFYGSDPLRSATPISRATRPPYSGVVGVRTSLCSDTAIARTRIVPSESTVIIISPIRAGVRYRLDPKRIIAAPIASPRPIATDVAESLGDLAAWRWQSDGHTNWGLGLYGHEYTSQEGFERHQDRRHIRTS
jgi:hypothetical protein